MSGWDEIERTPGQAFAAAVREGRGVQGVEVRALVGSSTSDTTAAGVWAPSDEPQTPYGRRRRLWVPDLLRRIPTGMNRVPYIRELNPLANEEGGASAVAEAAPKPEMTVQFDDDEAFVRKIAGFLPMTTEILDDGDGLAAYLDARLPRLLKAREEQQILNGAGGTVEIRGLRNTPGLQTFAGTLDRTLALAKGAQKVERVDGFASGVVMNVDDFWGMVTTRSLEGHFDLDPFADDDEWSVWKSTIVRTRALPTGKALVGDWEALGLIRDREQITIRLATQHDDWLTRGKLAAVVEQRLALTVEQPDLLCEVTFA